MEDTNFDRKKVIADMESLKSKVLDKTTGAEIGEGQEQNITVKYLGKIGLSNERGEIIDKDWYAVIEQHGGQVKINYYAENQIYLGYQMGINGSVQSVWEIPEKLKQLKKDDIEEAKTLEELEQEQDNQKQGSEEAQQLPGLKGPQLTNKQAMSLNGPKIDMNQQVDNVALAKKIGLTGNYIKFVQIDEVSKLIPDLEIDELGQQFVPIEIYADGTADIVGEDKLKFSTLEGTNNTNEQTTMNNDGSRTQEQGIVTFDIVGTRNCITVGFDELNTSSPFYEAKFGTRDVEQPSEVLYDELETTHEGPLKQEKEKGFAQINNTEGMYEASKEPVTEQQAEELARARGWYKLDDNGNVIGPDIEKATEYLRENSIGDNSVQELIEQARDDAKTREPQTPTSHWE